MGVCSSLHRLDFVTIECMTWNTESEKLNWRLLNKDAACKKWDEQIDADLAQIIQLINQSFPIEIPKNSSMLQNLSQMINRIKFTPKYIAHIPNLIAMCHREILKITSSYLSNNIAFQDSNTICQIMFGHHNYDVIDDCGFTALLSFASKQIMFEIMLEKSAMLRPELDCWRFLYGFILIISRIHCQHYMKFRI